MHMSIAMAFNLGTALIFGVLAWLLWWQAMPTLILRRTRFQAYGVWMIGMAMVFFMGGHLDMWMAGIKPRWTFAAGDICLIGAAIIELIRARRMGRHHWGHCPKETL